MEEKKVIAAKQPLTDPMDLLKESWEIYKKFWQQLVFFTLLPYLSLIPFALIGVGFVYLGIYLNYVENYIALLLLTLLGVLITIVYFSITFSLGTIASLYRVSERSEKATIKELLKKAWHMILPYWWVSFLVGMLTVGGFFLFIIPGIIFSIWFSFALYILVSEKIRGMDALVKSREYVKGYWWGIFGRILLISLFVYLISYVPAIIFQLLDQELLGSVLQMIVSILVTPLSMIYMFLTYESVKKVNPIKSAEAKRQKMLYVGIAVLGLLVFFVLFYFFVTIMMTSLGSMEYTPSYTPKDSLESNPPEDLTRVIQEL